MSYIYKIYCLDENVKDIYIGRTNNIKDRTKNHKFNCKTQTNKLYTFINNNGGWNNWKLEILEENAENIREQFWCDKLNATLNSNYPQSKQTSKEWMSKRVLCPYCEKEMSQGNIKRHINNSCKFFQQS